ncbi:hypothetical protein ACH5RR_011988 [Cinchona calisaya]|uniref:CCHC-type domain-containing protein n=1 Tax=Cinchona calisaya TaxID=153742 RepID=A0ABD3A918_9GENT
MEEFDSFKQIPNMSVLEYASKFNALGRFSPTIMVDLKTRKMRFIKGLNSKIESKLVNVYVGDFGKLVNASLNTEAYFKQLDEEFRAKRSRPVERLVQIGVTKPAIVSPPNKKRRENFPPTGQTKFPLCNFCHRCHSGECHKKSGVYFKCGQVGHMIRDCPKNKKGDNKVLKLTGFVPKANT